MDKLYCKNVKKSIALVNLNIFLHPPFHFRIFKKYPTYLICSLLPCYLTIILCLE